MYFQLGCSSPVIAKDPLIVVFLIPAFVRLFRRPGGSCFIPEAKLGHAAWHIDWISTRVWGQLRAIGVRRRGTQFSARASTAPPSFVAIKRGWAAICCRQASKLACDMPAKMAGAPRPLRNDHLQAKARAQAALAIGLRRAVARVGQVMYSCSSRCCLHPGAAHAASQLLCMTVPGALWVKSSD